MISILEETFKLCLKDKELIEFNLDGFFNILTDNLNLLPLPLRNNPDYQSLSYWLTSRTLPIDRANTKWILNALGLPQDRPVWVALQSKSLSVSDSYWTKSSESGTWALENLYDNPISTRIRNIALTGRTASSPNDDIDNNTPELTTQGTYAKCWNKEDDGIYLYKARFDSYEPQAEYISSIIADKLQISHVHYDLITHQKSTYCKCKTICSHDISIAPIYEYLTYKNTFPTSVIDWLTVLPEEWHKDFYTMLVFDTLIGNTDRHLLNWGVLIDNSTGNIIGLHPLFDHNCAIDIRNRSNFLNLPHPSMKNTSMLKSAQLAYNRLPQDLLLRIHSLLEWYYSKEAKKIFRSIYHRLDELDYLKHLAHNLTNTQPPKPKLLGILKF